MILECPSCHARYLVQIGLFAQGGRTVRCARCKHSWHATLPSNIEVFAPLPEFAPEMPPPSDMMGAAPVMPGRTTSPSSPISPSGDAGVTPNLPAVIRKWNWRRAYQIAAGVVLVVGLLSWPILDRDQIVKVLPGMRGFYESLGLHIAHYTNGLIFDGVKSELRYDGGTMKLYVDGIIQNTTPDVQFIPSIVARALGPDHAVIQSWWVDAPAATVAAGSEVPFHTEINAPMKRTIEDVYLEFYTEGEKPDVAK